MTAEIVNSLANWLLVASLICGVVATYAIVVSGNVKEKGFKGELSKANADAEKAKADAANANLRAQAIEHENITLRNDLEKTIIEADTEKQKLARTQIEVANAQTKQKEAEIALIKLKKQVAGRELSAEQQKRIVEEIKGQPSIVSIYFALNDPEVAIFADQIKITLLAAGWKINAFESSLFGGYYPHDLYLEVSNLKSAPASAFLFQKVFQDAGYYFDGMEEPNLPPQDVIIKIMRKAPPK